MPSLMIASERQAYDRLDSAIRDAHGDGRPDILAARYADGGTLYEDQGETDAACFFWTQAYVFALDAGIDDLAEAMRAKLDMFGRMG